jgi:hypothetical protein
LGEGIEEGSGEILEIGVKRGPGKGSYSTGHALARILENMEHQDNITTLYKNQILRSVNPEVHKYQKTDYLWVTLYAPGMAPP